MYIYTYGQTSDISCHRCYICFLPPLVLLPSVTVANKPIMNVRVSVNSAKGTIFWIVSFIFIGYGAAIEIGVSHQHGDDFLLSVIFGRYHLKTRMIQFNPGNNKLISSPIYINWWLAETAYKLWHGFMIYPHQSVACNQSFMPSFNVAPLKVCLTPCWIKISQLSHIFSIVISAVESCWTSRCRQDRFFICEGTREMCPDVISNTF